MKLHELKPDPGSHKRKKRVGRGSLRLFDGHSKASATDFTAETPSARAVLTDEGPARMSRASRWQLAPIGWRDPIWTDPRRGRTIPAPGTIAGTFRLPIMLKVNGPAGGLPPP